MVGMISRKLVNFYGELAKAKGKESWEELLNCDGKVINAGESANRDAIHLVNCFNNPIYCIDKMSTAAGERIEFNIGTYLAIRNLINGKSVVLHLPPQTYKTTLAKAYVLYTLLFTEGYIAYAPNGFADTRQFQRGIAKMYHSLPEYLKLKPVTEITNRIITESKKDDDQYEGKVILCLYDDLNKARVDKLKLDITIPTLICNRLGEEELWDDNLVTALREVGANNFVQVRYNMFDLGYDMEYAKKRFKDYGENLETFLKENVIK